jgi:hypothetical protein
MENISRAIHHILTEDINSVDVPNAETSAAMIEADELARKHSARFSSADELFYDLEANSKIFAR